MCLNQGLHKLPQGQAVRSPRSVDACSIVSRLICLCFLLKSLCLPPLQSLLPPQYFAHTPASTLIHGIAFPHTPVSWPDCKFPERRNQIFFTCVHPTQVQYLAQGDAPFALCSSGHPGLDDCPRVMPSVTFTSPKCLGIYDKAHDHPVNKQQMNAGCWFYEICLFIFKITSPLFVLVITGR